MYPGGAPQIGMMPQAPMMYFPQGYNPNLPFDQQKPQKQVKPKEPEQPKPKTYEDAMKLFEDKSQKEQEKKKQKKNNAVNFEGDEYYGEEEEYGDEYGHEDYGYEGGDMNAY